MRPDRDRNYQHDRTILRAIQLEIVVPHGYISTRVLEHIQ